MLLDEITDGNIIIIVIFNNFYLFVGTAGDKELETDFIKSKDEKSNGKSSSHI